MTRPPSFWRRYAIAAYRRASEFDELAEELARNGATEPSQLCREDADRCRDLARRALALEARKIAEGDPGDTFDLRDLRDLMETP